MVISLGRTIGSPLFLFLQLVNMATGFLFVLGVVRVVMEWQSPSLRLNTTHTPPVVVDGCFHVPLRSLFQETTILWDGEEGRPSAEGTSFSLGSVTGFFTMHVLAAVIVAPFLAVLVGRRKFVADFVVTLYGFYFILTSVMTRRLRGGGVAWWAVVLSGAAVLYAATWAICWHRELQDITLSSPPTPQPPPATSERYQTQAVEFELETRNAPQRRDNTNRLADTEASTTAVAVDLTGRPMKSKFS